MGTTGAPWIQGYVADRWIAPPEHAPYFSEKLLQMPECFLGPSHRLTHQFWGTGGSRQGEAGYDDGERADVEGVEEGEEEVREAGGDASLAQRRAVHHLPPHGPLLCFFNQHFKIDPATFGVWMRAITAVDAARRQALVAHHNESFAAAQFANSTLWMLRGSPVSQRNLRRELEAAGLAASQLVFAPRVKVKKHLRRASLCDIALDTHEYNSGATAADTLFAGVPTVHLAGNKAVGRMVSAMLNAARLPELIVRDFSEYETLLKRLLSVSHGRHSQPFTPGGGGQAAEESRDDHAAVDAGAWKMGAGTGGPGVGLGTGAKLKRLGEKLRRGILRAPLFDVAKWVADLEQLSRMTWEVHLAGYAPMHIIPVRPLQWF